MSCFCSGYWLIPTPDLSNFQTLATAMTAVLSDIVHKLSYHHLSAVEMLIEPLHKRDTVQKAVLYLLMFIHVYFAL